MAREFKPSGPLTLSTVPMLQKEATQLLGPEGLRVDLSAVSDVDSSALALLISLRRSFEELKAPFEILHAPEALVTLARLYNVEFVVDNRQL